METAYTVKDGCIIIHREMNDLDLFVKAFLDIIRKHTTYLIVSGYISISTGRTRATEDVDILVPLPTNEQFKTVFDELTKAGFWCYQGDSSETVYEYLESTHNVRFSRAGQMFPNMEFIPVTEKKHAQSYELNHPQRYRIRDFEFLGSPLEFEIAYKEEALGSEKDLEDVAHLRIMFKEILSEEKLKTYTRLIRQWIR